MKQNGRWQCPYCISGEALAVYEATFRMDENMNTISESEKKYHGGYSCDTCMCPIESNQLQWVAVDNE